MKKFLKKLAGAILTLILFCVGIPWIVTTSIGAISGSIVSAFMTGFKKGTFAYTKIQINLAYLKTIKEDKKLKVEE